jgi:mono/diheme cytochrome c family protein
VTNRGTAAALLALAGTAGVLILGHSYALAQGRAAQGNADNGQRIFAAQKCEACHGSKGEGGTGAVVGPHIGGTSLTLAMFVDHVRNPKDPMPPYSAAQISDAALADVYAFLESMPPSAGASAVSAANGSADSGKRLFMSSGCWQCHDREGQGGAGTGPRLAPNPISFEAFVHQCRQPADEMPPYTNKVLSDAGLADIYAYLSSIPKPPAVANIPLLQ